MLKFNINLVVVIQEGGGNPYIFGKGKQHTKEMGPTGLVNVNKR